jgi:hypothetical protein
LEQSIGSAMSVAQERKCRGLSSEIDAGEHDAKTSGGLPGTYLQKGERKTLKDSQGALAHQPIGGKQFG